MLAKILNFQTKTTFSAALLLSITMFGSRVLGLLRDRILAGRFGAGDALDMYYAAFQVPDFLYMVLIMGAVSTAFLPVFTEYFHRDQKEAWKLANQLLNLFLWSLIAVGIILVIFAPWLVKIIAPGFSGEKYQITVRLTQIMFLSPVIFGISNIVGVILQFFNRFLVYSVAPLFYNIGIIIGALFFVPLWGVYGLAGGVILGAFMHMIIQLPVAFLCGFWFRPTLAFFSGGVRKILALMAPRSFGLAIYQLSFIVFTALASFLSSGAIAVFNFSNNLQYLPAGIFGISFAVASFPALSKFWVENSREQFFGELTKTFRSIVFFAMPLSAVFFILRVHIVRVILESGAFSKVDVGLTSALLGMFAPGIVFAGLIPLFTRAFYAQHNTKTPVVINIVGVAASILFALFFLVWFRAGGVLQESFLRFMDIGGIPHRELVALPLGIVLGNALNFFLLVSVFLRNQKAVLQSLAIFFIKILMLSLSAGFIGWISLKASLNLFDISTFAGILAHGLIGGIVIAGVYILCVFIFGVEEIKRLWHPTRFKAERNIK